MRVLLTGSVGAGKTTQALILSKRLDCCLIDPGMLLRERAQHNDSEGSEMKAQMMTGDLVDNQAAANMVKDHMDEHGCSNFVIDGYPRSLDQLKYFDPEFDKVIFIKLGDEEVLKRLELRHRLDDTPKAIEKRLEIFHSETEKVIEHYRSLGKLVEVDGSGTVEEVAEKIWGVVK